MRLNSDVLKKITFLTGSSEIVNELITIPAKIPFDETIVSFLNDVSHEIMKDTRSKAYSDVVTFGFWIRKSSIARLKERFISGDIRLGKGVAFHIAPSNVPVNFAYSLVCGLLCGNANIVRVPSKDFPQVTILTDALNKVLANYTEISPYILLVRYGRDIEINDLLSSIADVRIIWGGNNTIAELRKSPLPPRSSEVLFADRFSLAVIDSDSYMSILDKKKVADDFYNDTFFSDQNACTSPRVIVWTGDKIEEAKSVFWRTEHELAIKKYAFQSIQGINKLTKACLLAIKDPTVKVEEHHDNLIIRLKVSKITDFLMDYRDNCGYFYEYDCKDILDLIPLCNDKRCQTIAYIGDGKTVLPLIKAGVKGIDRVVPMGKTMDFDLLWDGYNLSSLLTRTIVMA